ncbi:Diguanylate cyclase DosC [Afipia felis]
MQGVGDDPVRSEDLRAITTELKRLYRSTSPHARGIVSEIVKRTSTELADHFFRSIITQPGAHFYLDHETVNKKLHHGLKRWLDEVFQRDLKDVELFTRRQMQVGWAHARIKVPERLISRAARELKNSINASLWATKLAREDLASAVHFVSIMLDLALDIMTQAYIARSERNARSDEAFRLFSLNHNLATERERQRAALAEWAQTLFFELQIGSGILSIPPIAQSEFGLWVYHRANLLFDHSPEYNRLMSIVANTGASIEALQSFEHEERILRLRQIKNAIGEMNSLVGLLFDRSLDMQGARDPLTQLLNRKFVDTVISAEIETQKLSRHPFSALLIEIDRFNDLRARMGEVGADVIVQRTAQMIFDAAQSSDSVFSMGRETFLVIRVETELPAAQRFADEIAERYASTHFTVNGKTVLECSLSIGVVEYDGHPDPRELINRAQKALLKRRAGRHA